MADSDEPVAVVVERARRAYAQLKAKQQAQELGGDALLTARVEAAIRAADEAAKKLAASEEADMPAKEPSALEAAVLRAKREGKLKW